MDIIIYILLFFICILLINIYIDYKRSKKLTYRISKYTIMDEEDSMSIIENIKELYRMIIDETSNILLKFNLLKKYSFKYTKYLNSVNNKDIIQMNFVTKKLYLGLILSVMYFTIFILTSYKISIYLTIFFFIFGFYIYDIILIIRFYKRKRVIENELANAIMLMNNSFKAGKSLMQAVKVVSNELDGPISNEFSKIYTELSYGLSVEVVFQRFYNRTKVDNIKYIASSLSILSKTGGNIIKVFDEVEKTLINKKEYEKEKDALTASSRILIKFVSLIPILIIFIIYIIDNSYFKPLYESKIGLIISLFILLDYIVYIICIKKILRVRV